MLKIMTKNYIHLNHDGWLDKYNHLREYCPQLVKIYSINDNESKVMLLIPKSLIEISELSFQDINKEVNFSV